MKYSIRKDGATFTIYNENNVPQIIPNHRVWFRTKDEAIDALAYAALKFEWGSEAQIDAENTFFEELSREYGIDWEQHDYLLKATLPEAIAYAQDAVKAIKQEVGEMK